MVYLSPGSASAGRGFFTALFVSAAQDTPCKSRVADCNSDANRIRRRGSRPAPSVLFNSTHFLFVFLPVALLLTGAAFAISRPFGVVLLIITSLVFYGYWSSFALLIVVGSIALNFALAQGLIAGAGKRLLVFGITAKARPRVFQIFELLSRRLAVPEPDSALRAGTI